MYLLRNTYISVGKKKVSSYSKESSETNFTLVKVHRSYILHKKN